MISVEQKYANLCCDKTERQLDYPAAIYTLTGKMLFCAYEKVDEMYLRPVTAYEI